MPVLWTHKVENYKKYDEKIINIPKKFLKRLNDAYKSKFPILTFFLISFKEIFSFHSYLCKMQSFLAIFQHLLLVSLSHMHYEKENAQV